MQLAQLSLLLPAALLSADGFKDSVLKNPASFFEKKLDQKTLHRFFQGFPAASERGSESLALSEPVLTKGVSVYLAALSLVKGHRYYNSSHRRWDTSITNYALRITNYQELRIIILDIGGK